MNERWVLGDGRWGWGNPSQKAIGGLSTKYAFDCSSYRFSYHASRFKTSSPQAACLVGEKATSDVCCIDFLIISSNNAHHLLFVRMSLQWLASHR